MSRDTRTRVTPTPASLPVRHVRVRMPAGGGDDLWMILPGEAWCLTEARHGLMCGLILQDAAMFDTARDAVHRRLSLYVIDATLAPDYDRDGIPLRGGVREALLPAAGELLRSRLPSPPDRYMPPGVETVFAGGRTERSRGRLGRHGVHDALNWWCRFDVLGHPSEQRRGFFPGHGDRLRAAFGNPFRPILHPCETCDLRGEPCAYHRCREGRFVSVDDATDVSRAAAEACNAGVPAERPGGMRCGVRRAWLTEDVRRLAEACIDECVTPEGPSGESYGVLADALEDAGCDDEMLLCPLRGLVQTPAACCRRVVVAVASLGNVRKWAESPAGRLGVVRFLPHCGCATDRGDGRGGDGVTWTKSPVHPVRANHAFVTVCEAAARKSWLPRRARVAARIAEPAAEEREGGPAT